MLIIEREQLLVNSCRQSVPLLNLNFVKSINHKKILVKKLSVANTMDYLFRV